MDDEPHWSHGITVGSAEWDRRIDDAKALERWLYPRLQGHDGEVGPWPVADVADALDWTFSRVREAVDCHEYMFLFDEGSSFEIDGE
ncbi:MAG: hypothetical protein AAFM92_03340 [Pseudomonadota bacterium]